MAEKEKKDFDKEATAWDENPVRVKLGNDVADAIISLVRPTREMEALDIGCGTGLVTLRIQSLVKSITGADGSRGMLSVLESKVRQQGLGNVKTQWVDLEHRGGIEGAYDLIVSSMTLHHVPDTAALVKQLFGLLHPGGIACIADLEKEDGSFHPDNTGVFHFGFEREQLKGLFRGAGFSDVRDTTAARVVRTGEKGNREYPVILISGRKP